MFGTARAGTSHDIKAVPGPWRDAAGEARALRSIGIGGAGPAGFRAGGPGGQLGALPSAMLRDRKTVLIDRLGWDLESPDGLHEIDAYDQDETLYLIVHQPETGRHLGSVRLLPSTGPHLLGDHFAHLCADGVPRGPDVCEITRLVTAPALDRAEALQVRRQLSIALFEHALETGIARYTMVTHMPWLPSLLSIGWDAEPLGLPAGEGVNAVAALQILVNAATLDRLRAAWAMPAQVLPPESSPGALPTRSEIDPTEPKAS